MCNQRVGSFGIAAATGKLELRALAALRKKQSWQLHDVDAARKTIAKKRGEGRPTLDLRGSKGQVLSLNPRSIQARVTPNIASAWTAVTMPIPSWLPMGSRCLRSPLTMSTACAVTAAAIT